METRAFITHYENNHVPLICGLAPIPIVYNTTPSYGGTKSREGIDFDVVTELVFPNRDAYLAWVAAVGTGTAGEQVRAPSGRRVRDQRPPR